jgi:hypothetical protein
VFELSPSQGGWTEKILYSFTGGSDGGSPSSLLVGQDGNLYGTTAGVGNSVCGPSWSYTSCGVVFQLVRSGNGWTENVLYSFMGLSDGYSPGGLIQDSQGNLYGFSICWTPGYQGYCNEAGTLTQIGLIFEAPTSGGINIIYNSVDECEAGTNLIHGLTMDAAGELYAAEGGVLNNCVPGYCYVLNCGEVVRILPTHQPLVTGTADIFGNITSDPNGNLYGTASTCGFGSSSHRTGGTDGMIWQYSP